MRVSRSFGARRRLSSAHVLAIVALFFALTGSAAAVNKYLTPDDQITQGDLAGSTYGNPVIASAKITTAKFAGDATAPNAAQLGGHQATDYMRVVARGAFTVLPGFPLEQGQCLDAEDIVSGVDMSTDFALVNPSRLGGSRLTVTAKVLSDEKIAVVSILICNNEAGKVDPANTYRYVVLR